MQTIFVVLIVAAAVSAQRPQPCAAPRMFEGGLQEVAPYQNVTLIAKYSYDGVNRRERIIEKVDVAKERHYFDVLYLHKTRTMYVLDLKTRTCTRVPINRPWKPVEIPRNATFLAETYIGSSAIPGGSLLVQTWFANLTSDAALYVGTWSVHGCIPVSQTVVTNSTVVVATLFDVTLGISNPNVFIPPKECFRQGQVPLVPVKYSPENSVLENTDTL